ncbi:MAG: alpha/beta hydrolase [Promethearchaeota archaeon]
MSQYHSAFHSDDDQKSPSLLPKGKPFWYRSNSETRTKAVVICIHGHGATTYEVKPIGKALCRREIDAAGLVLPAHGIENVHLAKRAMGKIKRTDYLDALREEIQQARQLYDKVFIYGQSMGGALALVMAAEHLVDACAVSSAALKLPVGSGLLTLILGKINLNLNVTLNREPFENEVYSFRNSQESRQLYKLSIHARNHLNLIQCPLLVCHSHRDLIIDPVVPHWIQNRSQGEVTLRWYDESGHCLPLDKQGPEMARDIAHFFLVHAKK